MRRQLLPALRIVVVMIVVTGLAYPLLVTGISLLVFPGKANSSLVRRDGVVVGSALQGQVFTADEYFHSRPSAAGEDGYDGSATSGSNFGPTNEEFLALVSERVSEYRSRNGLAPDAAVPVDAVTASGSGLDPHISVANALLQVPRVSRARGVPEGQVETLIARNTQGRGLGVLGEPGVNVLLLNLALDEEGRA
ncbi:MAG: K(+)-transporting ATPase subunit C [Egibacteraceae bacterium]